MKQLLGICVGLLLTLAAVLGAFHLFYTPTADTLLLVPGGAFKRISNLKDYEQ